MIYSQGIIDASVQPEAPGEDRAEPSLGCRQRSRRKLRGLLPDVIGPDGIHPQVFGVVTDGGGQIQGLVAYKVKVRAEVIRPPNPAGDRASGSPWNTKGDGVPQSSGPGGQFPLNRANGRKRGLGPSIRDETYGVPELGFVAWI